MAKAKSGGSGYFDSIVMYAGAIYMIIGIGVGILLTYPVIGTHPLRWGFALIALGVLALVYRSGSKK